MNASRLSDLTLLLRTRGRATAAEIGMALGISQPMVSRLLVSAGDSVVKIGRARATHYALSREVGRAGRHWPLYRITVQARAELLGQLHALHADNWLFVASASRPAFTHDEFANGVFPGLPWFLDDQRPQGFLGRAFARRVAANLGAPPDLARWQADDVVLALLRHGDDMPGDLVLGEYALQQAMQRMVQASGVVAPAERQRVYPEQAELALRGEDIGSSAGGEQPKFTAILGTDGGCQPVIVKFSERAGTPAAQRWADLLRCEHLAGEVLRNHGLPAAQSEIVEADGRVFLQSTRFDRTPQLGRLGFVSLAALDAAHYGHGRIDWWQFARQLQRDQWLNPEDARRLAVLGWFGALIANSDMHLGNAGVMLADNRPLALAPAYDMLPMALCPASSGEVVRRDYSLSLPTPGFRDEWRSAALIAIDFWQRVAQSTAISSGFRAIAADALSQVQQARALVA
jgi:hypothetical protein